VPASRAIRLDLTPAGLREVAAVTRQVAEADVRAGIGLPRARLPAQHDRATMPALRAGQLSARARQPPHLVGKLSITRTDQRRRLGEAERRGGIRLRLRPLRDLAAGQGNRLAP